MSADPRDDFQRLTPYLMDFAEAALMEGEDTCLICALALRETRAGWAPGYIVPPGQPRHLGLGDGGHGFGLFQMDDRGPYAHLPRECPEASPMLQARWACAALRNNRANLADFSQHPLFERAVIAAYNAYSQPPETYNALRDPVRRALVLGHDPDSVTTPGTLYQPPRGDYGADVLHRRDALRENHPETFPPPSG